MENPLIRENNTELLPTLYRLHNIYKHYINNKDREVYNLIHRESERQQKARTRVHRPITSEPTVRQTLIVPNDNNNKTQRDQCTTRR